MSGGALDLGTIPLPKLLHLVATLDGGLGGSGRAASGDIVGHLLPVVGTEVAAAEGVPLIFVGFDEGDGLFRGPTGRRKAAGRRGYGGEG